MTTQNGSNELRVIDADIEKDLEGFGIVAVAGTIVKFDDRTRESGETGSTTTASDGAVSGVKVEFGDGNVTTTKILVPIQNAMSVQAADLNEKNKAKISERAEKSKKDKERDGIGE